MKKKNISIVALVSLTWLVIQTFITGSLKYYDKIDNLTFYFNIMQLAIMMIGILIPFFLHKKFGIYVPVKLEFIYNVAILLGILFGDVYNFFGIFSWWDSFLHFLTGVLLAMLWFIIMNTYLKHYKLSLSPGIIAITSIGFVLGLGVIWEIFEYCMDGLLGINMQQFLVSKGTFDNGEPLVGHAALYDTMKDLILATVSSVGTAIVGCILINKDKSSIFNEYFIVEHENKGLNMEE